MASNTTSFRATPDMRDPYPPAPVIALRAESNSCKNCTGSAPILSGSESLIARTSGLIEQARTGEIRDPAEGVRKKATN